MISKIIFYINPNVVKIYYLATDECKSGLDMHIWPSDWMFA